MRAFCRALRLLFSWFSSIRKPLTVSGPTDYFEASRAEKLQKIEQLGLDPWGGRFDGHQPIGRILELSADQPQEQRPRVRAAGRIVARRKQGKLYFVDLWDWTTPTRINSQGQERRALQVLIGQEQVGDTGWA